MPDNTQNRGPRDRTRINIHEPYEVEYWRGKFGCTESELRRAVTAVGVMVRDVAAYLKRQ